MDTYTKLTNLQSQINSLKTKIKCLCGLVSNSGAGYLVYTALLSQESTDAPVATVLENTLGGTVVWSRAGVGDYWATSAGLFTEGKTACFVTTTLYNSNSVCIGMTRQDNNACSLYSQSLATGAALDINTSDNPDVVSVEIRVYP